ALSIVYFYSDRAHRTLLSFPTRRSSDLNTSPEASCAADRRRLTHVPGRMEERDAAQHRRAGSTGKRLHQSFRTRAECAFGRRTRSEVHTSELQSQSNLVCRLLLEKKNLK